MKNSRMKITVLLLTATFALAGCQEKVYELTLEEEAAVVSYAAHAVAKYNTYQQDGEVFVLRDTLEHVEEATEEVAEAEGTVQGTKETNETGYTDGVEDTAEAGMENAGGAAASTLTDALDLGVVQAEYMGCDLCDTYEKSELYAVDAVSGKQFLVVKVNLTNTSEQNLHVDLLSMVPEFRAVVNDTETVAAQTSILQNDLSTYQEDIMAGETKETVLLFEISRDIQEISSLQLKVSMNEKKYTLNLGKNNTQ